MNNWEDTTLQEVSSKIGDGLHGTPEYEQEGEYYFINGNNLSNGKIEIKESTQRISYKEYLKYKKPLNNRTILISINGTLGNIALYNGEKCILGKSACYINVLDHVNKNFIKYVLLNKHFQEHIRVYAHGTTIQNVSLKTVREYSFKLPSLVYQENISEILSSLDDKIDLLHRQNKTLEALAETLFRQWFIEEADESWDEVKVKNVCKTITKGTTPTTLGYNFTKNGINFLKAESITEVGELIENKFAFIDDVTHNVLNRSKIEANDVIITIAGTIGRVAIVTERFLPANTNQAVALLRVNKDSISPYFLYYLLRSRDVINDFESRIVHAVQPNLSLGEIGDISFKMPEKNKLMIGENILMQLFDKKEKNNVQIRTLIQLRDTLLPKLMSGEVRVEG